MDDLGKPEITILQENDGVVILVSTEDENAPRKYNINQEDALGEGLEELFTDLGFSTTCEDVY